MISVITPTIGRPSLRVMLEGLVPQLSAGDEVWVLGDGPQPQAEQIVTSLASPLVRYVECPWTGDYGNPQRNQAIGMATGSHLMFVDDDDRVMPGAIGRIKSWIARHPDRPLMFKMQHPRLVLWQKPVFQVGNVSGQMFICPKADGKVGAWTLRYEADFDFMSDTLARYPAGALVWVPEITCIQGLAGKKKS